MIIIIREVKINIKLFYRKMQILRNIRQFSEVIKFSVSGVMDASKGIKTNIIFTLDNGNDGEFENFLA